MNELLYLDLTGTDAARNLATEELVFDRLPEGKTLFMLWQNRSAVIIGKYQNTLAEIDLDYVRAQGIQVVRRLSDKDYAEMHKSIMEKYAESMGKLEALKRLYWSQV